MIYSKDKYFLKKNLIKFNYFLNFFNLIHFLKLNKRKSIISLNSSHISNIKSKEHFESNFFFLNIKFSSYFFIDFLKYNFFKVLFLRDIKFNFKYFIEIKKVY